MISRENNFDLIRLFAALEVAIGHVFHHLQVFHKPSSGLNAIDCSGNILYIVTEKLVHILSYFPGVIIFFVISGFLISSSIDRSKSFGKYFKNRILRIIPALWIAFILVTIALIGCGFITFETFTQTTFWMWVIGQTTLFQFYTPDLFRNFGVGTPNGSLWTIPVEFIFYLILPILLRFPKRQLVITIVLLFSIAVNLFLGFKEENLFFKLIGVSVLPWLYIFLLGTLLYYNWKKINRYLVGKGIYYLIIYILYVSFIASPAYVIDSLETLIANCLLGLVVISLAYTKPELGEILKGFDLSYGLYVYHMIVVNIFVQMGWMYSLEYAVTVLFISIVLGGLSWYYVEKNVLKLKNGGTSNGII